MKNDLERIRVASILYLAFYISTNDDLNKLNMLWKTGMNSASYLSLVISSLTSSLSLTSLSCAFLCRFIAASLGQYLLHLLHIPFKTFFSTKRYTDQMV